MSTASSRASLGCVGVFDEESCRYFLRETGEQIVPHYPFSIGIEEVYAIMLEYFGRPHIADALSVLQELLEDDSAASGLGDDGDIWRSWRYGWRHRNDGSLNPLKPMVGNFVLPPPTQRVIRLLKADNFLTMHAQQLYRLPQLKTSDEGDLSQNMPGLSSQKFDTSEHFSDATFRPKDNTTLADRLLKRGCAPSDAQEFESSPPALSPSPHDRNEEGCSADALYSHYGDGSRPSTNVETSGRKLHDVWKQGSDDEDSQQEFVDVSGSLLDFEASLCLSFDMMSPQQPPGATRISLRGGDLNTCTLKQVQTPSSSSDSSRRRYRGDTESETGPHTGQACASTTMTPDNGRPQTQSAIGQALDIRRSSESSSIWAVPRTSIPLTESMTIATAEGHEAGNLVDGHICADMLSKPRIEMPRITKSTNRHARLIDGTIFRGKAKRFQASPMTSIRSPRTSPVRNKWTNARQNHSLRHSWFQGIRSMFRTEVQNKQPSPRQQASSASETRHVDTKSRKSVSHCRSSSEMSGLSLHGRKVNNALTLDGAFDDLMPLPVSPVNLNKPLPISPREHSRMRLASLHTRTPSLSHSQDTTNRPSTASTVSSKISQSSSRRNFEGLTRDLVKVDMANQHGLSPVHEVDLYLDPSKYDPSLRHGSPLSPTSFASIMNRNPFRDEPIPLTPTAPGPLSFHKNPASLHGYEARTIPPSRSEPNLHPFVPQTPRQMPNAEYYIAPHLTRSPPESGPGMPSEDSATPVRGRQAHRPEPQTRTLQSGKAAEAAEGRDTPAKRSRSPVKRFFGIGKSTSLRDIASEPQTSPQGGHVEHNKHYGAKSWSNKLRHGFLTSDVTNEEEPGDPKPSTQTPPKHSTFPVSLDPPYQAKVHCELELMLVVTTNRYLLEESRRGRISASSLARTREAWTGMNRPQVIDFQFDQLTQRELISANIKTLRVHGECAQNPVVLNTALYNWKTLAREMSIRTFCAPDSVIRKWMHDAHKIFEMLGAELPTFLAFQDLQVKTLAKMQEYQKKKMGTQTLAQHGRRGGSDQHERKPSAGSGEGGPSEANDVIEGPRKFALTPSSAPPGGMRTRKTTGAEGAVEVSPSPMSGRGARDAYEISRGGQLGLMMRDVAKH